MSRLELVTLGLALAEVDHGVGEEAGPNRGERIDRYLRNCDPPIAFAAPYCAAAMQYCSDVAADALGVYNPLDQVRLEAYVQSYHDWATSRGLLVPVGSCGDLVLFSFGGTRFDHMGILLDGVSRNGAFVSVEANTSPGVGESRLEREREGEGWYRKRRKVGGGYDVAFIRWT